MATLHQDRNAFSTLEWVWDDGVATAPEPLLTSTLAANDNGLEVDANNSGPEVLPGTSAEVYYNTVPPEVVDCSDWIAEPEYSIASRIPLKSWKTRVVVALVFLTIAALAIGLGVGLRKRPIETNPATPQKPLNSSVMQTILNDTSLAAAFLTNGDRHLFFQGAEGSLRRIVHTTATSQWILDRTPVVISDARHLTPMAAEGWTSEDPVDQIRLYYISASNRLKISVSFSGTWVSNGELSKYTISQNTRQLSLTSNLDTNNTSELFENETVNQSLLLFENSLGNVTALLRVRQPCSSGASDCVMEGADDNLVISSWLDISKNNKSVPQSVFSPIYYKFDQVVSSTLYESSSAESMLSTPFASDFWYPVNDADPQIQLLVCNNSQPVEKADTSRCTSMVSIEYTSWSNSSHGAFTTKSHFTHIPDQTSNVSGIDDSDLAIVGSGPFAIWVRGTEAVVLGDADTAEAVVLGDIDTASPNQAPAPNVSFPFKRMASITTEDGTASFLYHQINGTTFAEEQFVPSLNSWAPSTYITIPYLT